MNHFPISVNLSGKTVYLIGDGPQIRQKAEKMKPFEAVLTHKQTFTEADARTAPAMVIVGDTDVAKAEEIASLCGQYRIPVNVVDVPRLCSFYFPGLITKGDLTVSISTGGTCPAAAACLRERIENAIPDGTEDVLEWAHQNRERLKKHRVLKQAVTKAFSLNRPLTEEEIGAIISQHSEGLRRCGGSFKVCNFRRKGGCSMIPYSMEYLKRKVVIYARVSTEHEAQISALENQLDWYKPLLDFHPEWTLVERYVDEGITGTSAEKRPEFMRMMEDAKKHKFDLILTREVSRFARNTVDTLQYTRMLKEHGVEVYFINDGIKTGDGELRLTIMATLAQDESRKTSIRVKSGQQTSMDNGVYYGNGNILGYDRYEELLPDKTKLVEFHINPEQAKTVRLIFDMYLDGCGLVKIKDELERRGYKTSQGKEKWFPTVISHVLKNSFYCGIMTYHKEYTPDYLKQKKVKNYGELEFTQAQGKHEPIVTVEEFERVQRIMELKRTSCKNLNTGRTKGKKPRTTVWGKLLICECGHTFNMRKWDRSDRQVQNSYQCYSSVRTGSYESRKKKGLPLDGICQTPMIPEWRLQMMANLIFRKYLSQKDKVLALANSILEAHIGDTEETQDKEAILKSKQAELEKLSKKIDGYIEMRAEGDLSREAFRMKCAELEPRMQQLQKEIETLSAEAAPKEVVDYTEKLTVLQYALEQYTNIDEGQDVPESVIEAFVVKIVVSKDGFDWYLRFDGDPDKPLHCQLQGKRKSSTKILVSSGCSPSMDSSPTGRDPRGPVIRFCFSDRK